MRKRFVLPALLLVVFLFAVTHAGEPVAKANLVNPLLIGSAVPAVTLVDTEGNAVNLATEIQKKPTILVFYRGGW